ncbi:MAG: nicotinamide mononucleotide transporter [Nostoc sp. NMS1]|uniref:nicotinamide riboside transporter PnuC n=1 Tax=unclassified Nostoc TaxID=2593658 RepID=UPI0025D7E7DB|nr:MULTISPECIES: nicotinamide riboside transporter PnuC [unclassified Nostoc]MBN3909282.1 nicotinamide mononucleotide transporter [Nostoc sp. NMS1]MBN3993366.1 nicotinamide mononucleotide transporter [Nostoc sp. NMS2]
MSYIELLGTVFYLWSAWLISQRKILTWPVGIVSVLLYMALFYQIRLYSDMLEQIYYLVVSVYGWWRWSIPNSGKVLQIRYSPPRKIVLIAAITIAISFATGALMSQIHLLLPAIFLEKASFPYLDALTTIMSFTAMWLMVQKRIESWYYWIIVDVIGIGLYYVKEVKFIAFLYVILLFIAINGSISWLKTAKIQD